MVAISSLFAKEKFNFAFEFDFFNYLFDACRHMLKPSTEYGKMTKTMRRLLGILEIKERVHTKCEKSTIT